MKITIVGYDKDKPNGHITLDINELSEQDMISMKMLGLEVYPKGSMKVKMVIDGKSFYEGILEHTVRQENNEESSNRSTAVVA